MQMPLTAEQTEALEWFLVLEQGIVSREQANLESQWHESQPMEDLQKYRNAGWAMLVAVRDKYPEHFQDKSVFALSVAYMDRVLACSEGKQCGVSVLKKARSMPLACLWLAMKVSWLRLILIGCDLIMLIIICGAVYGGHLDKEAGACAVCVPSVQSA
jgi:hypothetical protein